MPAAGSVGWDEQFGQCRVVPMPATPGTEDADVGPGLISEGRKLDAEEGGPGGAPVYRSCPRGGLTVLGETQLERLGAFVRQTYLGGDGSAPLLSEGPLGGREMKVTSTRTTRTVQSARSLLRGMFPDGPKTGELDSIVQVVSQEILVPHYNKCHRLRQLFWEEKPRVTARLQTVSTRSRLIEAWGEEGRQMSMVAAGDGARAVRGHGHPNPPGLETSLGVETDVRGHEIVHLATSHCTEAQKLSVGVLLQEMQSQFEDAIGGASDLRLAVRSSHDITVTALIGALGLEGLPCWPEFATSIFVELLRDTATGKFDVRAYVYNGVPGANNKVIDITVPLEAWEARLAPLRVTSAQWEEQCKLPAGEATPAKWEW